MEDTDRGSRGISQKLEDKSGCKKKIKNSEVKASELLLLKLQAILEADSFESATTV